MADKLCWWCCHQWEGVEYHLPFKIDPRTKEKKTMGQFCSWNCMGAYVVDKYNDHKVGIYKSLIASSHKEFTGKLKIPPCAPDRLCLKAFGGTMDIDDFRNTHGNNMPILSMPNQLHFVQNVMRTVNTSHPEPSDQQKESKMASIKNTVVNSESLKLKRTKPLTREAYNIEAMIGLKRTKK